MKRMIVVAVLLFLAVAVFPKVAQAAPELEILPLSAPSSEMMAMAAAQVTPSLSYFYVATAVDTNARESVFSGEATATLGAASTSITLTWTASPVATGNPSIAGYNIYRSQVSGGPYAKKNAALVTGVTSLLDPFPLPIAPSGLTAKPN